MRKKQLRVILTVAAIVLVVGGIVFLAINNYHSSADPLVSMSYINETLTPALQAKFDARLKASEEALQASFASAVSGSGGGFTSVTMTSGQTLTCSAGSELLLVSGSAQVVNANAVSDVTAGAAMAAQADLAANHLYLVTAAGITVTAANDVAVMVRGTAAVA